MRRLTFLLVASLAVALAAPGAAVVVPPVPVRTPQLFVPDEIAGSGLAPEAAVRVTIDARGTVTRVETLSITPSSEYDELFRARLTETLSRWRYAPQLRDGVPEATTLEWRVRFPARPADASAPAELAAEDVARLPPGADAEERRAAVLALPEAQRLALLDAEVRTARGILDPRRTHQAATD